jgi:hypothetical protein
MVRADTIFHQLSPSSHRCGVFFVANNPYREPGFFVIDWWFNASCFYNGRNDHLSE